MRYIWQVKYNQWNPEKQTYEEQYHTFHTSSRKARKSAIDHMRYVKGVEGHLLNKYGKTFYSMTSETGETHCSVMRHLVQG